MGPIATRTHVHEEVAVVMNADFDKLLIHLEAADIFHPLKSVLAVEHRMSGFSRLCLAHNRERTGGDTHKVKGDGHDRNKILIRIK